MIAGFDGREQSVDALRLAGELARASGSTLEVATVLPLVAFPVDLPAFEHALATRFGDLFAAAATELGEPGFVPRRLEESSPARALYELAEREAASLIVVGSTHRGALGRIFPGSVAERLLSGAPCPIAVAPRGYAPAERRRTGVIGVGYDGGPESARALETATGIARDLDATLRLIAVVPPILSEPPLIGRTALGFGELIREHLERALADGRARAGDAETILVEGDPATELAAQAESLDLLVLGSRRYGPLRRTLLGGVSAAVMRSAPSPVVVVPRQG